MVEKIAKEFSRLLYIEIGDSLFAIAQDSHKDVMGPCDTHTYCDANMSMQEAYRNVKDDQEAEISMEDGSMDMCCLAWARARHNNFYIDSKEMEKRYLKWKA